jgi:hypothetical protein
MVTPRPLPTACAALLLGLPAIFFATAQPLRTEHQPAELFQGLFNPPGWRRPAPRPASHTQAWLLTHGRQLDHAGEAACHTCHTQDHCTDCHQGLAAPLQLHPPGWLSLHGMPAWSGTEGCASCHSPTRFCGECHDQAGLAAHPLRTPVPDREPHPPGWLDPGSRHNHATAAHQHITSCISCHSGQDCRSCHAFINPHGPDFRRRCQPMLRAAAPMCADCHTPTSLLPMPQLGAHPGCGP